MHPRAHRRLSVHCTPRRRPRGVQGGTDHNDNQDHPHAAHRFVTSLGYPASIFHAAWEVCSCTFAAHVSWSSCTIEDIEHAQCSVQLPTPHGIDQRGRLTHTPDMPCMPCWTKMECCCARARQLMGIVWARLRVARIASGTAVEKYTRLVVE